MKLLVLLFAVIALSGATFCDQLKNVLQTKISGFNVSTILPPQISLPTSIPNTTEAYVAALDQLYKWHPTQAQLDQIKAVVQQRWNEFKGNLSNATNVAIAKGCINETKTALHILFDQAQGNLTQAATQALALSKEVKSNIENYFNSVNSHLEHCQEVDAFEAYINAIVAKIGQKAVDFSVYVKQVLANIEKDSIAVLDAVLVVLDQPNNTTATNAVLDSIKQLIQTLHEADRCNATLHVLLGEAGSVKVELEGKLKRLRDHADSWATRINNFLASYSNHTQHALTPAQQEAISDYFRSNSQISFNFSTLHVTLTVSADKRHFTLTVTVDADGTGNHTFKLREFENSIKRWLLVDWGFHCNDDHEQMASTRRFVIDTKHATREKRVLMDEKRAVMATDSLSVTIVGSPGSYASTLVGSLLLFVFAMLFW